VHSSSNAGNLVSAVHEDLVGETDLRFTNILDFSGIAVLFLCMAHGTAKAFLTKNPVPTGVKIIDLSNEFRLKAPDHDFVYGLPELNRSEIQRANHVANCGCFATAIQLAVLPLAKRHLLNSDVHVHAITGSTGAGQQPVDTTHFSWRCSNVSIYKAFEHQHLGEILQSVRQLQPKFEEDFNFLPVRGDFSRGIYASVYTKTDLSDADLKALYQDFYKNEPFVVMTTQNPNLKQVINTNKCLIFIQKSKNKVLIISMIDNLIKGASGQAVQNMNLMFGLDETMGLKLKGSAF
jgi:N-acetyl-gamma-glutamyl-phosphate reductase